jgi:hypothetical protein
MSRELPPIAKHAMRVLVALEDATGRFPHRHKYRLGDDLRGQAMEVARAVRRAWQDREHQVERVRELDTAIDNLKLSMQLADEVHAFRSTAEFESIARLVSELGRQCGGWLKRLQSKGQNVTGADRAQSALILSARTASCEAHP